MASKTTNQQLVGRLPRYAISSASNSQGSGIYGVQTQLAAITLTVLSADIADPDFIMYVVDEDGNGVANPITIATQGAETINAAATKVLNTAYATVGIYSDGANLFVLSN